MTTPIGQLDLMAYADDQLDARRRREVEAHLSDHPDAARFVDDVVDQNKIIRARFANLLDDPVPERLEQVLYRSRAPTRVGLRIAAAIVLVLVGGLSGVWLGGQAGGEADVTGAVRQAANLHRVKPLEELRALPTEIPADGNRFEVAWLETAAPMQIPQPGLAEGYRLVAAEVTEIDGRAAVRLGFRSTDGRTLSLFLATVADDAASPVQLYDGNTNRAAYWFEGRVMWILTGDAEPNDLAVMAEDVHRNTLLQPTADLPTLAEESRAQR